MTFASFSARLLQTIMCPSVREKHAGRSPVAGSSSARVGRIGFAHTWWSQAPSVIQSPGGRVFANSASRRVKSAGSFV